jgi:hypothetical protein
MHWFSNRNRNGVLPDFFKVLASDAGGVVRRQYRIIAMK